jgi:glycosyltransferase involved in cell wall biosynthesis
MKKVMLIGPIGGVYGRDIEANLVAKALQKHYNLSFFSTGHITKNTVCTNDIEAAKISSLREKFLKNPILFLCALTSWCANAFKNNLEDYSKNRINAKLIKKYNWDFKILEREIKKCDLIICFVQLSSSYLESMINICDRHNIKIIVRTTGHIKSCPINLGLIKRVNLFIHHSTFNKENLERYSKHNFTIIDQATTLEDSLLKLKNITNKGHYTFGFIGRLNQEKGILEIIDVAIKYQIKLLVAGDGELKEIVQKKCKMHGNIIYLGYLGYNELHKFYENIDVSIINSVTETGPLTGLEAMCSSRFIISKKVGAMVDRLNGNENIWINDSFETSLKLFFTLTDKEIENKSLINREIYIDNYCQSKIKACYLSTVNRLLNA